ncbi:hypothetical protein M5E87_21170 [Flavonifractor plautii]|nr:hypothetical protein M5E87_21170 [Flavonifractor plautii]
MRASEISGLTWGCVDFRRKTITIKRALVRDKDNHWVEKGTKTTSSTRTLSVPDYIMEKLAAAKETSSGGDRVVPLSSESMYKRLKPFCASTICQTSGFMTCATQRPP